jgi:broad specificity phosphatase PhoE
VNLYLLRHGETAWNREQRLQGIRNIPLNRQGILQSRRLAGLFRSSKVTRVITSPLARARCTTTILLRETNVPVLLEDRLREIDHGPWSGLLHATIAREFPDEFAAWNCAPEKLRLAGSEHLHDVYARCSSLLSELLCSNGNGDVLLVTHGVVIALLLCAALGAPISQIRDFSSANGSLSALKLDARRIVGIERDIHAAG